MADPSVHRDTKPDVDVADATGMLAYLLSWRCRPDNVTQTHQGRAVVGRADFCLQYLSGAQRRLGFPRVSSSYLLRTLLGWLSIGDDAGELRPGSRAGVIETCLPRENRSPRRVYHRIRMSPPS